MPPGAARVQRATRRPGKQRAARVSFEPEIVAHPDIMVDRAAIAERQYLAQHPLRRLVIGVVVARCDRQGVLGHHDIADLKDRSRSVARDVAQFDPPLGRAGKRRRARVEIGWDEGDKQPVYVVRPHRVGLARKQKPAIQRIEVKVDDRVLGTSARIVPQPHIPAARGATGIAPLDGQRWAIDRIERHDAAAPPAEGQAAMAVVPPGFVSEKRMIPVILRVPDQSCQIATPIKHGVHP